MPVINKTKIVPYTQEQMYALVNEIEKYPDFVPWCVGSQVLGRNEDEVRATLSFARSGLHKSFTTLNRLQPHKMIEIRLIDGPFKHLEGFWRFEVMGESRSRVSLDLEFEFASRLFSSMAGHFFHQIAAKLVDAFCDHAKNVYGALK